MFKSNLRLWNICQASPWAEVTQPAVHAKGHGQRLGTCPPSPAAFQGKCLFSQTGMDPTSSTSFFTSTAFAGTAQGKFALLTLRESTLWGANLWVKDRPRRGHSCLTSEGRWAPSQARITHFTVFQWWEHIVTLKSPCEMFLSSLLWLYWILQIIKLQLL